MALNTLRSIGFIIGIFLLTLAVSMLIPMLTLVIFDHEEELSAFTRSCLITALAAWLMGRPYLAVVCILPYLVVWGGSLPLPGLRHAGRWGDPSYGMYLYAFPIQQWVIAGTLPNLGFAGSMALSLALTTAMAYLSWHALEKHALRLKPHRSHSARPAPVALQASSAPQASPPTP